MSKKKEEAILNGANIEVAGVRELSDGKLSSVTGGVWMDYIGNDQYNVYYYKPRKDGLFQLKKESGFSYHNIYNRCETLRERGYTLKKDDLVYVRTEDGVDVYGRPQ